MMMIYVPTEDYIKITARIQMLPSQQWVVGQVRYYFATSPFPRYYFLKSITGMVSRWLHFISLGLDLTHKLS